MTSPPLAHPKARLKLSLSFSLVAFALVLAPGCRCADCDEDDDTEMETLAAPWRDAGVTTESQIIGVYATDFDVLVFTPRELVRCFQETTTENTAGPLRIVDKRRFRSTLRQFGQPAVNNLAFARGTLDTETGEEIIEFQTVLNAGGVAQVVVDSVRIDSTFDELVALETKARTIGAFSRDARVYAQPIIRRTTRTVAIMLIRLDYDETFERFTAVEPYAVVDLPGTREDDRPVSTIRFLDGFFFVATKFGGYRISRAGEVEEVIGQSTAMRDFFKYEGDFYAAREGTGDLLVSNDGVFFRPSPFVQDFGVVEVLGDQIVVQRFEGWPYFVADELGDPLDSLALNGSFARERDRYYGLDRLRDRYYLGLDRTLYVADTLPSVAR